MRIGADDFNPRSPHGERRLHNAIYRRSGANFNPRSPHGERRAAAAEKRIAELISTHAPRTGSDSRVPALQVWMQHFNPRSPHGERPKAERRMRQERKISTHAPRTGSDATPRKKFPSRNGFQPTLPARGATTPLLLAFTSSFNFNPRSPHGERRDADVLFLCNVEFQPTLPARGATDNEDLRTPHSKISTHAPRTGSDLMAQALRRLL